MSQIQTALKNTQRKVPNFTPPPPMNYLQMLRNGETSGVPSHETAPQSTSAPNASKDTKNSNTDTSDSLHPWESAPEAKIPELGKVANQPAREPSPVASPTNELPESQRLQSKLDTVTRPPSLKEQVAKAALSFAPTAIAGLAGGRAAAAGAAQGVNTGLENQQNLQRQEKASLLEQVENARNREERAKEHDLAARTQEQGHQERLEGIRLQNQSREEIQGLKNQLGQSIASSRSSTTLRKLGLDANGDPIPREQLTPAEQSRLSVNDSIEELHQAQTDHANAQAEFERTRNDPNSPAFKLAQQRLQQTQQRLDLSRAQTESRLFGTNNGKPLPGALLTDEGTPVGSSYSQNVRPTSQQRGKSNMGESAKEQLDDISGIVERHPEIFGPGHGQISEIRQWMGTQDPDAQRFMTARTIAGDHLAGTFGGRSEAALTALDDAIGQFKTNPAAMKAGLEQINKANNVFINAGKVRTVGSNAAAARQTSGPKVGEVQNGYVYQGGDPTSPLSWKKK